MGLLSRIFWRDRETRAQRDQQHAQEAAPDRDVTNLLREIIDHVSLVAADTSQEDKIAKLVSLGPSVIPEIESTVRTILYGDSVSKFKNGGLLCQAIGRIGGEAAFDILRQFATQESNIYEYQYIRADAARGLAYLSVSDNRASGLLQDIGDRYGLGETIKSVLEQLEGQPAIETWDTIVKTFIMSEINKEKPDFKTLSQRLQKFSAEKRHVAWIHVAEALFDRGDKVKGIKCYIEALYNYPNPLSLAWGWLSGEYDRDAHTPIRLLSPDAPKTRETVEKLRREYGSIVGE